jgi:hypothetical protein
MMFVWREGTVGAVKLFQSREELDLVYAEEVVESLDNAHLQAADYACNISCGSWRRFVGGQFSGRSDVILVRVRACGALVRLVSEKG